MLGQQVLQRVAGDLAGEAAELGADDPEVGRHERAQLGHVVGAEGEEVAVAGDDVEGDHVVGHPAVSQRPGAAGIVADHAAHGAAVRGGRVRAEAQADRAGGDLQLVLDHAGVDHGRARPGVDRVDPVEVPGGVDHQARADGVTRARGAGSAGCDGGARLQRGPHEGDEFVGGAGVGHRHRRDAVQRRVAGVQRPRQSGGVDDLREIPETVEQVSVGRGGGGHPP